MRKKEITKLLRALLQDFPDYEVQGDMMYGVPISHVLKGVVLDRSISPSDYYAHVFLQPLYVPSEHVVLSLGWRLGGGVRSWNLDSEQDREEFARLLNVEAIPFLNKIHGPQDIIWATSFVNKPGDLFVMKARAYSFARIGNTENAVKYLDELIRFLGSNLKYEWQNETYSKATFLKKLLIERPQDAQRLLDEWEQFTVKALKLGGGC